MPGVVQAIKVREMAEPAEAMSDETAALPGLTMPKGRHWAYVATAVVSVFGLGLALGDQQAMVTALWAAALLLSLVSLVRPTLPAWLYLFGASAYAMVVELGLIQSFSVFTWLVFAIVGLMPCMALWSARPRRKAKTSWLR